MEGEAAYRLQKCFSPGVISIRKENGLQFAVVNEKHSRYDMSSRNVFRYDDLKDAVLMSKVQDHFICKYFLVFNGLFFYMVIIGAVTIESVGALAPDVIFREAVTILKEKCTSLLSELNS